MQEKTIEARLTTEVRKRDGICIKMNSLSMNGLPDRLVLLPPGRAAFAEIKRPGKKPTHLQLRVMAMLSRMGFLAEVIDHTDQIEPFLKKVQQ